MKLMALKEILNSTESLRGEKIIEINPISGGCIHDAWNLKLKTGQQLFAKTSQTENFPMFEFEANSLTALNEKINRDFITVPKPIQVQKLSTMAILIMPWLHLVKGDERKLGKGIALLHQETSNTNQHDFGWESNGFIGNNQQISGWEKSWGKCFVNFRLTPQIQIANEWGLGFPFEKFSSRLIEYLDIHNPKPCLVHGDLWQGNAGVDHEGKGAIFDPAIWMADREVDIAMSMLFGGFTNEFYEGYQEIWPLPDDFENRLDIYNLYHVLNHANLFGGHYKQQSISILKKMSTCLEKY